MRVDASGAGSPESLLKFDASYGAASGNGIPEAFSPDAGVCPTSVRCYGVSGMSGNGVNWSADGGQYWLGGPSGASSVRNAIRCSSSSSLVVVT